MAKALARGRIIDGRLPLAGVGIDDVLHVVPMRGPTFLDCREHVRELMSNFEPIDLVWIPRARNSVADALARSASVASAQAPGKDIIMQIKNDRSNV